MKRCLLCLLILVGMSAAVGVWALAAAGGNPNPQVIPLNAKVGGLTYGDWGDGYWSWQFSIPAPECPVLNGAGPGQVAGPVFMLSNVPVVPRKSHVVECSVTVGGDQALFLPLATSCSFVADDCLNADGTCALGYTSENVESYFRECNHTCISQVSDLYASVDGRELHDLFDYRAESSHAFACPYAEHMQWAGYGGLGGTIGEDAGEIAAAVTDGYYLLLSPLSPGEHVVSYGASWPQFGKRTVAGVTYHVTVK